MSKIQEIKSNPKEGNPSSYHTVAIPKVWMGVMKWKKGYEIVFFPNKNPDELVMKRIEKETTE